MPWLFEMVSAAASMADAVAATAAVAGIIDGRAAPSRDDATEAHDGGGVALVTVPAAGAAGIQVVAALDSWLPTVDGENGAKKARVVSRHSCARFLACLCGPTKQSSE
jgi:hypothetical protein